MVSYPTAETWCWQKKITSWYWKKMEPLAGKLDIFLRCYDWERNDCEGSYLESNCEVLFHIDESYWNFLQEK